MTVINRAGVEARQPFVKGGSAEAALSQQGFVSYSGGTALQWSEKSSEKCWAHILVRKDLMNLNHVKGWLILYVVKALFPVVASPPKG